jgi:polyisoprenoid-binding protein YceI
MIGTVRNLILCAFVALPATAVATEKAVVLDPAASQVTFTLATTFHEVHGSFGSVDGTIRFDPETGVASGEVVVDARRAATGNAKRDATMHAEVLESAAFPAIRFRVERVEGRVVEAGHSELRLTGVLVLHGVEHPMTIPVSADFAAGRVSGELDLAIPYVDWGLHDPSFLVARAAKSVDARVHAEGRVADAAPAGH